MTGLAIGLGLILIVLVVRWMATVVSDARRATHHRRHVQRLRREVVARDQRIAAEHRRARRDMNKAAGQAWRNQFEGP